MAIPYRITVAPEVRERATQTALALTAWVQRVLRAWVTDGRCAAVLNLRTLSLVGVLLVAMGLASAQTEWINIPGSAETPAQAPLATAPTGEAMRNMANAIINTISNAFDSAKGRLNGTGETITYFLFAIVFAWALVKAMVQGDGINAIIAEIVPLAATLFIIELLILQGGAAGIVGYLDGIAAQFGGTGGGLKGDITAGIQSGMAALVNIFSMPSTNTSVSFSLDFFATAMAAGMQFLFAIIGKLLAGAIIVVATGIYVANVVIAHGSIVLALAMAPIMVPWLIVPAMSWVFDSWLKFTIGAGMIKIVGAFMLSFTSALMNGMANLSNTIRIPGNADWMSVTGVHVIFYMGLALVAFLAAYLSMMIPGLASGLVSGSAKGAGFGGLRALTSGVGFGAINAGAATGARATGSAASAAGGGIVGGVRGAIGASQSTRVDGDHKGHLAPSTHKAEQRAEKVATYRNQTPMQSYGRTGAMAYKALGGKLNEARAPAPPPPPAAA